MAPIRPPWGVSSTEQRRAVHAVLFNRYTKSHHSVELVEVTLFDCHSENAMILWHIETELSMSLHSDSFSFRVVFVVLFCLWNEFSMSQWQSVGDNPCEGNSLLESPNDSVSWTDSLYHSSSLSISLSFACVVPRAEAGGKKLRSTIQRSTETGLAVEMRSRMTRQASRESTDGSMNSYSSEGK